MIPARIHAEGNVRLSSPRSMVSSDLTASIWGRVKSREGVDGKFQRVLRQRREGVDGILLTSQMTPKSHDTAGDSLFILKHAMDFTAQIFIKVNPLRMK